MNPSKKIRKLRLLSGQHTSTPQQLNSSTPQPSTAQQLKPQKVPYKPKKTPKAPKPPSISEQLSLLPLNSKLVSALEKCYPLGRFSASEISQMTSLLQGKSIECLNQDPFDTPLSYLTVSIELLLREGGSVLVLAPTFKLARKIFDTSKPITEKLGITSKLLNASTPQQLNTSTPQPLQICIGTPASVLGSVPSSIVLTVFDQAHLFHSEGQLPSLHQLIPLLPLPNKSSPSLSLWLGSLSSNKLTQAITLYNQRTPQQLNTSTPQHLNTSTPPRSIECPPELRLRLLLSLLKKQYDSTTLVIFSSHKAAEFYSHLMTRLGYPSQLLSSSGSANPEFKVLCSVYSASLSLPPSTKSIIFCDLIAELPQSVSALSSLYPSVPVAIVYSAYESPILSFATTPLAFPASKILKIQPMIKRIVSTDFFYNQMARSAFFETIRGLKEVYRGKLGVEKIDLNSFARSFGMEFSPKVDFNTL